MSCPIYCRGSFERGSIGGCCSSASLPVSSEESSAKAALITELNSSRVMSLAAVEDDRLFGMDRAPAARRFVSVISRRGGTESFVMVDQIQGIWALGSG